MKSGTINDITNLKFYTDRGIELPILKSYVITWELNPGKLASLYILKTVKGYFIGDVALNSDDVNWNKNNLQIKKDSLLVGFIENGEIFVRFSTSESTDKNGMKIFSYKNKPSDEEYFNYVKNILFQSDNTLTISINIKNKSYTHNYNISDIFELSSTNYSEYFSVNTVYTGDNIANNEYYQLLSLTNIDLVKELIEIVDGSTNKVVEGTKSYVQTIFENNVPNIGLFFPFVRYSGDFYQDKISANFIAANTLLILEECIDASNNVTYEKPYINADSEYSLVFQPTTDSEIKIISSDSEYNIQYVDEAAFLLADEDLTPNTVTPLSFSFGFLTDEEGAYLNLLGIYMRSILQPDIVFFMGALSIKTEVEGEDERFRTLLDNFGVPDPYYYSNIFAEQDFSEEEKDFELINRKSKELFMSYPDIFSYVGTYKALFRAIKFLGYNDIIFKEWYTLRTSNDDLKDIAVQVFDTSTGTMLKLKLADYGVSIEDFTRYNKINRLTMIYHLNERDETNYEYLKLYLCYYNKATGKIITDKAFTKLSEVPLTRPIYEYRNDEILAKLLAVKVWLERHIVGIGAYIADITGEGIYFGWQKTQSYVTKHDLADYSQEQYYTPDVKKVNKFINSSTQISCTLNELNNAVSIEDYEDTPFEAFIKYEVPVSAETVNGISLDISTLYISNTIEAPVLGDEYEFDVVNRPETGTLYEWTNKETPSQIYINEGEINLLFDKYNEASIDSSCLPIITLENANIHNVYGNWRENLKWLVREVIDQETGNVKYKLNNYKESLKDSYVIYNNDYITLYPGEDAYIKYTEDNKWQVPMFIIHNYKFGNVVPDASHLNVYTLNDNNDYVLEILKGDMLFKNIDNCGAQLSFSNDVIKDNQYATEQSINVTYTYHSERKPFTLISEEKIKSDIENSTFDYSAELNIEDTNAVENIAYYNKLVEEIQDKTNINYGCPVAEDVATIEASTFINTSIAEDISLFNSLKKELKEKALIYDDYIKIYNNNYTFNNTIDVDVTRLGKYDVITRAYDKYNNIFTAKYDNQALVEAAHISIDTYIGKKNSLNDSEFYRFNKDGILCDSSIIADISNNGMDYPEFPKNYRIYDFDYNRENNSVDFDNISYAIDSPKNNDYVLFENYSELCVKAEEIDSSIKLYMLDENPLRVNLFNPDTYINICVYDPITQLDIAVYGSYKVIDSYKQDTSIDTNYEADSYVCIDSNNIENIDEMLDYINSSTYKTYILNTTEYEITSENILDVNTTYRTCNVSLGIEYQVFNIDDVIKVRYYLNTSIDSSCGEIINEVAYRITDVKPIYEDIAVQSEDLDLTVQADYVQEYENTITHYIYSINGIIDTKYIDSKDVRTVLTYATHYPVHYTTRVTEDGFEYNYNLGYENYSILKTNFNYNSKQIFLDDYVDDTYSGIIYDYDPVNLKLIWFNTDTYNENTELYYYHNFPVTVEQGNQVVFSDHDVENVFIPGYHTEWKYSTTTIDDTMNWDEHKNIMNKETLFRSINKFLSIKPEYIGSQTVELQCVDRYGNRLINKGDGLLYVNRKEDYVNQYEIF